MQSPCVAHRSCRCTSQLDKLGINMPVTCQFVNHHLFAISPKGSSKRHEVGRKWTLCKSIKIDARQMPLTVPCIVQNVRRRVPLKVRTLHSATVAVFATCNRETQRPPLDKILRKLFGICSTHPVLAAFEKLLAQPGQRRRLLCISRLS